LKFEVKPTSKSPGNLMGVLRELSARPGKRLLLGFLLFMLVVGTFLPALKNDFIGYDDPDYVTSNTHVQQGLTTESTAWAFRSSEAANWHPLTWLSHCLDWELFGPAPWGHHLTSVLLHALTSTLVFVVLLRTTGSIWPSFVVAALFGVHPLRVESVAWVSERKDVLGALFWMLTLYTYSRYVVIKATADSGKSKPIWYCAA